MIISLSPLLYLFSALLFTFVTVELNDYFRCSTEFDQAENAMEILRYSRWMAFAVVWAALSLPLILIARKNEIPEFRISGLSILLLSVCLIFIQGIEYTPVTYFRIILNSRLPLDYLYLLFYSFINICLLRDPGKLNGKKRSVRYFKSGL